MLSYPLQLALVALAGAVAGSFSNWAIHSLGFFESKPISPWSKAPEGTQRRWFDYLPIVGWLSLARESSRWGRGHWVRPLLIEAALAAGLGWLYHLNMRGDLLPADPQLVIADHVKLAQFVGQALLIVLMTIATFIDLDEKTIPDTITLPGTLLGLLLAAGWPDTLPQIEWLRRLQPLWVTGEFPWPAELFGFAGLLLGVLCFVGWCYAMIPKLTTLRRGWWKGWVYLHVSTFRSAAWWQMGLLAIVGSLAIFGVWMWSGPAWQGLLTALCGMAFGGAMIWGVRIVGYLGLRKEAMGFGDVTLMAMIGAFVGWQATIIVFFLAPLAAVVIAVLNWAITRRRDIAFGPYLCAGAVLLILQWPWLWENYGAPIFRLGWFVPALLASALFVMLGLLMLVRLIEEALFGTE
jgi:leader peptidase (prepilin peptidase) / N-methyltransferase